jgi:hypothetical protein
MNEELQKILTNLADAGCGSEELQKAKSSTKPVTRKP